MTFVVSNGLIAWAGQPMQLDRVLKEAAEQYAKVRPSIQEVLSRRNRDPRIPDDPRQIHRRRPRPGPKRSQFLLGLGKLDEAMAFGHKAHVSTPHNECNVLHFIVWLIPNQKLGDKPHRPVLRPEIGRTRHTEGRHLDTLARLQFASGNFKQAASTEQQAIEALNNAAELSQRLKQYRTDATRSR